MYPYFYILLITRLEKKMKNQEQPTPGLVPQKDGSVAISIECPNGLMTPKVLDVVREISERFNSRVHLTTAQKMMLLDLSPDEGKVALDLLDKTGITVRKTRDLSQPKVCVGKPFCPLALQETFPLGEYLYKEVARIPIPPKMKIAVSGCPACCSWANLADVGFMGLRSGFRVLIGGHGGSRPVVGEKLCMVTSIYEAGDLVRKITEIFDSEVKKKARLSHIIKRLGGMDEIKNRLDMPQADTD